MPAPELELNFFPLRLPESISLATRVLRDEEKLRDGERRWRKQGEDGVASLAVLVAPSTPASALYSMDPPVPLDEVPPGIIEALASEALKARFVELGYTVEPEPVGFSAFKPSHTFPDVPGLLFLRGMEFRSDCLVEKARRRQFGFFVSVRVRRRFARHHTQDPAQGNAAIGEYVTLLSERHTGTWRLTRQDDRAHTMEVSSGEVTSVVSSQDVVVPASASILRRYGPMVARRDLLKQATEMERRLSFRCQANGRLDPARIAKQRDCVATWLIEAQQFGRIDFRWQKEAISMAIQPLTLREQ